MVRCGVALSGGGSRAYVAALGQLAALTQLGHLDDGPHIAAVSGGGWAAVAHSWQRGETPQIMPPSTLNEAALSYSPPVVDAPHLAVSKRGLLRSFFSHLIKHKEAPYEAWRSAVYDTLLQPLGIEEDVLLEALQERTGLLRISIGAAVLGDSSAAPFDVDDRSFGCVAFTPDSIELRMPWRPSSSIAPDYSCRPSLSSTVSIADALALTSFFPGAPLQTQTSADLGESNRLRKVWRRLLRGGSAIGRGWLGRSWRCSMPASRLDASATGADGDVDVLLADGGSVANLPLPLLLADRVERILCLINVGEPLPSADCWDPHESALPPNDAPFSEDLSALFGVLPSTMNPSKDLSRSQCFEPSEFAPLISALQAAMATGRGALTTAELTTVANEWWGIEAGVKVLVSFVYVCECPVWEAALPDTVRDTWLQRPPRRGEARRRRSLLGDASRASPGRYVRALVADVRRRGALDSFPQYPLSRLRLSAVESNALYQQSGWVLTQHAEELERLFGGRER